MRDPSIIGSVIFNTKTYSGLGAGANASRYVRRRGRSPHL